MPTYYGSWTLDITSHLGDEPIVREVRMILIEYISGVCMLNLDPDDLSQAERKNIMRKVIEAEHDVRYAGVRHEDLSPRNIISATSTFCDPDLRVTLIDFGSSTVERIVWGGPPLPQYNNPLFRWVAADTWSTWGWLPKCDEERVAWMWSIYGDGCEGKYIGVERDLDDELEEPRRPARSKANRR